VENIAIFFEVLYNFIKKYTLVSKVVTVMSQVVLMEKNYIEYVRSLLDIWNKGDCAVLLD